MAICERLIDYIRWYMYKSSIELHIIANLIESIDKRYIVVAAIVAAIAITKKAYSKKQRRKRHGKL